MDLASRPNLDGCVMFVTYASCSNCAQSIIQRGIKTIVVDSEHTADKMPPHWIEDMTLADRMLKEAGVTVIASEPDKEI